MYLLWRVYYSSPKRVTDLLGKACICCGGFTMVLLGIPEFGSTDQEALPSL